MGGQDLLQALLGLGTREDLNGLAPTADPKGAVGVFGSAAAAALPELRTGGPLPIGLGCLQSKSDFDDHPQPPEFSWMRCASGDLQTCHASAARAKPNPTLPTRAQTVMPHATESLQLPNDRGGAGGLGLEQSGQLVDRDRNMLGKEIEGSLLVGIQS